MTDIFVSVNYAIIIPCNGIPPVWHQAIIWTDPDLLSFRPLIINWNLNKNLLFVYAKHLNFVSTSMGQVKFSCVSCDRSCTFLSNSSISTFRIFACLPISSARFAYRIACHSLDLVSIAVYIFFVSWFGVCKILIFLGSHVVVSNHHQYVWTQTTWWKWLKLLWMRICRMPNVVYWSIWFSCP